MALIELIDVSKTYRDHVSVRALTALNLTVEKGEFAAAVGPFRIRQDYSAQPHRRDRHPGHRHHPHRRAGDHFHACGPACGIPAAAPGFRVSVLQPVPGAQRSGEPRVCACAPGCAEARARAPGGAPAGSRRNARASRQTPRRTERRPAATRGRPPAILPEPDLILADEPTANLDSENAALLLDMMERLNRELAVTFLFSTHDPAVMRRARRLIRLKDGRLIGDEMQEP